MSSSSASSLTLLATTFKFTHWITGESSGKPSSPPGFRNLPVKLSSCTNLATFSSVSRSRALASTPSAANATCFGTGWFSSTDNWSPIRDPH